MPLTKERQMYGPISLDSLQKQPLRRSTTGQFNLSESGLFLTGNFHDHTCSFALFGDNAFVDEWNDKTEVAALPSPQLQVTLGSPSSALPEDGQWPRGWMALHNDNRLRIAVVVHSLDTETSCCFVDPLTGEIRLHTDFPNPLWFKNWILFANNGAQCTYELFRRWGATCTPTPNQPVQGDG